MQKHRAINPNLLSSRLYCRYLGFTGSVPNIRESRTITAGREFSLVRITLPRRIISIQRQM